MRHNALVSAIGAYVTFRSHLYKPPVTHYEGGGTYGITLNYIHPNLSF